MTLAGPRCRLPTRLARRRLLLLRHWDAEQRETLRVSGSGINLLAATRQRNQAAINAHEARVSAWRARCSAPAGSSGADWACARHCRAAPPPPLGRRACPTSIPFATAYLALSSQCWHVLREGIAQPQEVPEDYGVMLASEAGLEVARAAPRRSMRLPFEVRMVPTRATAEAGEAGRRAGLAGVFGGQAGLSRLARRASGQLVPGVGPNENSRRTAEAPHTLFQDAPDGPYRLMRPRACTGWMSLVFGGSGHSGGWGRGGG